MRSPSHRFAEGRVVDVSEVHVGASHDRGHCNIIGGHHLLNSEGCIAPNTGGSLKAAQPTLLCLSSWEGARERESGKTAAGVSDGVGCLFVSRPQHGLWRTDGLADRPTIRAGATDMPAKSLVSADRTSHGSCPVCRAGRSSPTAGSRGTKTRPGWRCHRSRPATRGVSTHAIL